MRYLDWDVIIFPENSRVPIQEFKTGCFVVQDPETTLQQSHGLPYTNFSALGQIPAVNAFIPNLPQNFPFRVSIHCWEKPPPVRRADSANHNGGIVIYDARVFVDGHCDDSLSRERALAASYRYENAFVLPSQSLTRGELPEFDKNGNRESLKFPPFHQELLSQSWWNPAEDLGRIKVLISEGFPRERHRPPFERVKNIVMFTFQHAPLKTLESAGIAWPNPSMWYQMPQALYQSPRKDQSFDSTAHSHSPRRRNSSGGQTQTLPSLPGPYHHFNSMGPPSLPLQGSALPNNQWVPLLPTPDPFLSGSNRFTHRGWAGRLSSGDQSMPDYSHSITPVSSRSITASDVVMHSKPSSVTDPLHDEQYDELVKALTPNKDGLSGTFAPANTRSSSTATNPIQLLKPSAAADARAATYVQVHRRKSSAADSQSRGFREVSDIGMKSKVSEDVPESTMGTEGKIQHKPSNSIRGKKEGKKGGRDSSPSTAVMSNSAEYRRLRRMSGVNNTADNVSGPKRKRSTSSKLATTEEGEDPSQSSPIRKASRPGLRSGHSESAAGDKSEGLSNSPLATIQNAQ
ncbi:MAG: hypothetical protein M1819_002385 [Sarea resinae]|nr:MAG: hypothetical protein M1819_002385 [Sarea resinae]